MKTQIHSLALQFIFNISFFLSNAMQQKELEFPNRNAHFSTLSVNSLYVDYHVQNVRLGEKQNQSHTPKTSFDVET